MTTSQLIGYRITTEIPPSFRDALVGSRGACAGWRPQCLNPHRIVPVWEARRKLHKTPVACHNMSQLAIFDDICSKATFFEPEVPKGTASRNIHNIPWHSMTFHDIPWQASWKVMERTVSDIFHLTTLIINPFSRIPTRRWKIFALYLQNALFLCQDIQKRGFGIEVSSALAHTAW